MRSCETGPASSSGGTRLRALVRRCEAAQSTFSLSGHGAALPGLPRARTQARLTCGRSLCCPRSQVCAIRSVAGASWSAGYVLSKPPAQRSELGDLLSISPSSLGARCRVVVSPLGCWVEVPGVAGSVSVSASAAVRAEARTCRPSRSLQGRTRAGDIRSSDANVNSALIAHCWLAGSMNEWMMALDSGSDSGSNSG